MKISAKAEYACLAVLALAARTGGASVEVSGRFPNRRRIPERYLVQILLQLKGAGLVTAREGLPGGYRLARDAKTISLARSLRNQGPEVPRPRRFGNPADRPLLLDPVWESVRAAERAVLDHTTIAQLVESLRRTNGSFERVDSLPTSDLERSRMIPPRPGMPTLRPRPAH